MNNIRQIIALNEQEIKNSVPFHASWHARYKASAWVYIGGLSPKLSEGDILAVFSQWGEIEDLHLPRDEESGRSRGFAFLKYERWESTVLAVDNMTGVCAGLARLEACYAGFFWLVAPSHAFTLAHRTPRLAHNVPPYSTNYSTEPYL